jgi:Ca2+-binding EF-hand superfamily protein
MSAMRKQMFSKTDGDQDGKISRTELSDMMKSRAERNGVTKTDKAPSLDEIFSTLDSDSDGSLSMTEMEGLKEVMPPKGPPPSKVQKNDGGQPLSAEELFTTLDADSDGSLSMIEMEGLKEVMPPKGPPPGGGPGGPGGPPPAGVKGSDDSEETSSLEDLFDALDTDGDGILDIDEFSEIEDLMSPENQTDASTVENSGNLEEQSFNLEYLQQELVTMYEASMSDFTNNNSSQSETNFVL